MDDVLHPLRCVYDVDAAGAPPQAAPPRDAPGHAEWRLLEQTRRVLDRWPSATPGRSAVEAVEAFAAAATEGVRLDALAAGLGDAPARRPSDATVVAVEARAADATLAAVRQVYGETSGVPAAGVEAAFMRPVREWLDAAPRTDRPSAAVLAAVAARAEEASRVHGTPDVDAVTPALAPLAAAYGFVAAPDAADAEIALLSGTRDAVALQPRERPDAATLASIAAFAAEASAEGRSAAARSAEAAVPAVRPAVARPSLAGDRAPAVGGVARARHGTRRMPASAWAGSAALAGVLVIALVIVIVPRVVGDTGEVAETTLEAAAPDASPLVAEALPPPPAPSVVADEEEPAAPAPPPTVSSPSVALAAPIASGIAAARLAVPRPSAGREASPAPSPRPAPVLRSAAPAEIADAASFAPVAARTASPRPAPVDAWNAAADVRTLAMRVRALRQATPEAEWDAPAEAFGAPRTPMTMSATPGFQSVRAGTPARARILPDSSRTGN